MGTEVGTAVSAVVSVLIWEQRMWRGRDISEGCSEGSEVGIEDREVGTAVAAVVRALRWEQRMWYGKDISRCCREGSEVRRMWRGRDNSEESVGGNRGCGEVGTSVGAVVRALR